MDDDAPVGESIRMALAETGGPVRFAPLLCGSFITISVILPRVRAQEATITQLRAFLLDERRSKHPDDETAARLSSISLSERLTNQALNELVRETMPGSETVEQLELLRECSIFAPPPARGGSADSAPPSEAQGAMLRAANEYAHTALQHLPDFLAVRDTRRFDNLPRPSGARHKKPKIQLHSIGEFNDPITYRNGAEIAGDSARNLPSFGEGAAHAGLMSMGEFGPVLAVVFSDIQSGNIAWSRWEPDSVDGRLAVFQYSVPKSASHYLVDYCCYTEPQDENAELRFYEHPAYHGELVLSPSSGAVRRITIVADLDSSAPVVGSNLAVQYGKVQIGGQSYVCPVQSVAITASHSVKIMRIDGKGIERHLNLVRYRDYHKFGSTSRMIASP